jgi:lipopolysaccharide transport system permease protein
VRSSVKDTTIEPVDSRLDPRLGELWEYRELLFFLVWRDIKVRYKQTFLGASWAILQPLLTMVVFTIFFGNMAGIESQGLPYPIFSYTALLIWTFVAQGVSQSSQSLVGSANLIRKVYFPRLIIPLSSILAGVVDFVLAFSVLLAMMAVYGIWPNADVVFLPVLLAVGFLAALGVGLWLSALNVEYRDVKYVVPFVIQIWLFVSPVIYPAGVVMERLERFHIPGWVYGLNPMVGVVEGFRWSLLGVGSNPWPLIAVSAMVSIAVVVSGVVYFRRMERTFADVV